MSERGALRVAVALSGGVDSAVTALLLRRCVPTVGDLRALMHWPFRTHRRHCEETKGNNVKDEMPSLEVIQDAIDAGTPWSRLRPCACGIATRTSDTRPVQLVPLHLHSWDDDHSEEEGKSCAMRCAGDYGDAERVAHALGLIPETTRLPLVDTAAAYMERCFNPMLRHYAAGATLNVDVLCNSEVKLGALLAELRRPQGRFGAVAYLATGHYSRTLPFSLSVSTHDMSVVPLHVASEDAEEYESNNNKEKKLVQATLLTRPLGAGVDLNDQSLFLAYVPAAALRRVLFPLGHVFRCKRDVRSLAAWWGSRQRNAKTLHRVFAYLAEKKTSTGLCFVTAPSQSKVAVKRSHVGCNVDDSGTSHVARSHYVSCKSTFVDFLHDYMAPLSPNSPLLHLPPTRFVDLDTNALLDERGFALWPQWRREWREACLPAYCVTVGQKLQHSAHDGTHGQQTYYVCSKVVATCATSVCDDTTPQPLGLQQVSLVTRWNDARLYRNTVCVRDVRLPCDAMALLHRRLIGRQGCRLRCWCCTRHQDTPQPAWLAWDAAEMKACGTFIARMTAVFDRPVRALTPGQVLVGYVPLVELGFTAGHTTDVVMERGDWAVVLCGWIV